MFGSRIIPMLLVGSALGALGAETAPKTETVTYRSGTDTVSAFLAEPVGSGPFPGILVIHEWWGLDDWVKDQARRLAGRGYAALAIDLYRGKVASKPEAAHELMRGVPNDRAATDLTAALAFLKSRKEIAQARFGVIGWCMGGGYAMDTALNHPEFGPTAICYGRVTTSAEDAKKFTGPILGIFGADDEGLPQATLRTFEKNLKAAGKSIDLQIYTGAGHAFMNVNNPGYRAAQTTDAWKRIDALFDANLKKRPT